MEGFGTVEKFDLADDVIELLRLSERKAKNRASAKRSKQRRLQRMEDLRAEYARLKLLDTALAIYHKEVRENAKAVVFHVGVMERILEKYKTRKTQVWCRCPFDSIKVWILEILCGRQESEGRDVV